MHALVAIVQNEHSKSADMFLDRRALALVKECIWYSNGILAQHYVAGKRSYNYMSAVSNHLGRGNQVTYLLIFVAVCIQIYFLTTPLS